jgi:hypothetical protein
MTAVAQTLPSQSEAAGAEARAPFAIFAGETAQTRAVFALCLLVADWIVGTILVGFWHPGRSFLSVFGGTLYWSAIGSVVWWTCVTVADTVSAPRSPRWIVYALTGFFAGLVAAVSCLLTNPSDFEGTRNTIPPAAAEVWWQVVLSAVLKFTLVAVAYYYALRWRSGRAVLNAARLERAVLSRRATETRLHAMQARVNPQFLFGTLAQVERLCDPEPARADRMLACLITYLRAAMPLSVEGPPSVAAEVALIQAFLELVRIRFDEHFADAFEVTDTAKEARMPSMLLLPLIDHAASCAKSSSIALSCHVDHDRQRLVVSVRFAASNPDADLQKALLPVRERVAELYGAAASLVAARSDSGTAEITLEIPHERTERSDR